MNTPVQFNMKVLFHFLEHAEDRRNWFGVGEDLHRRVPMEMAEVKGLNTVGMWFDHEGKFVKGDATNVKCAVIAPHLFYGNIKIGSKGRLWDGGFFADVEVTNINEQNLRKAAQQGDSEGTP